MGTNINQIATRADISDGKRIYAYVNASSTDMLKCPTKGEINQIEFLDTMNKRLSTTVENNTYNYVSGLNWTNSIGVGPNNTTVDSINIAGTPYVVPGATNYSFILTNNSPGYYVHNSTSSAFNVKFNNSTLLNTDINQIKNNSLWSKTIQTNIGKRTQIKISLSAVGYAATSRITNYYNTDLICNATVLNASDIQLHAYVFDANDELIYNLLSINATNLGNISLTFTSTTSSVTVYLVPRIINTSFNPKVTGNLYVGVGFSSTITTTIYDSYYDDDCKLAQYEDIGIDSARRFGVYYGVWNDKSTPARVDYARALINTTPDGTASGWTQVGQVTLSDIAGNGTRSGVITCTLPSNIDLGAQQYYLLIKVGDTLNNQDFSGGWGNSKGDPAWTYCRKSTSGLTPSVPLTPDVYGGHSVLNKMQINTTGGTATAIKGNYNTNSELKGWIRIY